MTLPQQLYLAMAVAGFSLFFVCLMATWIRTRGWAPRRDIPAHDTQKDQNAAAPRMDLAA